MYLFRSPSLIARLALLLAGLLTLGFQTTVRAQDDAELFNTAGIERSVTIRFKLSKNDRLVIHPVIERENRTLVLSYFRFSESNSDFLCLWNKVRVERHEAEASADQVGLSPKQRTALGKAREELERRVLEVWLGDYLSGLADLLELDRVQADCIAKLFERESELRRKLLSKESREGLHLNVEWEKITEEREACLKTILDPLQLHDYNLLFASNSLIA